MADHYGVIGAGALGTSLVFRLIQNPAVMVTVNIRSENRRKTFLHEHIVPVTTNQAVAEIESLNTLFLCVPPSQVHEVCTEIADIVHPQTFIVCLAAKIKLQSLEQWLPRSHCVIRAMTTIQFSPICFYSEHATAETAMKSIFGAQSQIFAVNSDEEIDAVTLVSGCGYALYSWFIAELLAGIPATINKEQLVQIIGATLCTLGNDLHTNNQENRLHRIISDVACHGGLTERMIQKFQSDGLDIAIKDAASNAMNVMNQD